MVKCINCGVVVDLSISKGDDKYCGVCINV